MALDIGKKIKSLRIEKNYTLRTLGEKTGYSIGFLSQLERGLTTIAVDALQKLAEAFEVELSTFFVAPQKSNRLIMKSYEREVLSRNENKFVDYALSNDSSDKTMFPRFVEIFPCFEEEIIENYGHSGEEFIYVLEGILSVYIDNDRNDLYPGDSLHMKSTRQHNWKNHTNKVVKIMTVHTQNNFDKGK